MRSSHSLLPIVRSAVQEKLEHRKSMPKSQQLSGLVNGSKQVRQSQLQALVKRLGKSVRFWVCEAITHLLLLNGRIRGFYLYLGPLRGDAHGHKKCESRERTTNAKNEV